VIEQQIDAQIGAIDGQSAVGNVKSRKNKISL